MKIKNYIKASIYFFIALSFSINANASWKVHKKAEIKNEEKHAFIIEQRPNGKIYARFVLHKKIKGVFELKRPVYKVDNNKVRNLSSEKDLKISKEKNPASWILWEIFDGKGPPNNKLLEIMMGEEIVFQYYVPDGTIKETSFELKGAYKAISAVLH